MQAEKRGWVGRWEAMRSDFAADRVVSTLATGVVLGAVNSLLSIALASLIFQGQLVDMLPVGIGLGLAASVVIAAVTAVGSSVEGMYAGMQDASAAIIGLAAASIAVTAGLRTEDTVIALIIVTSLATGVTLLLIGRFRLGEISRYVPFPVIGGLLAGTGYLIVAGSVEILGGLSTTSIFGEKGPGLFWPGLVLGLTLFIASRLEWRSASYLWILLTATVGFHLSLAISGVTQATSAARGWLLGPFPAGSLWPGWPFGSLAGADWTAVLGEAPTLVTVLLIVPMTVVLYVSALEVEFRRDIDAAVELQTTGWANIAAGAIGGPPGYMYLADTIVTRRLLGGRRGSALLAALVVGVVLMVGGVALEFLPQFVVGGLLLFVGFDFLAEWLWSGRRKMTPIDYILMVTIVVMVATVGFLAGVVAGLVIATVLFVVRYSQIEVVKHSLSAAEYRSNVERAPAAAEFLESKGDSVVILLLQGFIFFGTGDQIIGRVRDRIEAAGPLRFVAVDFNMVTGIDSSALMVFERLCLMAEDHGFVIVLIGLQEPERSQLDDLINRFEERVRVEPDLDRGVAWCEDRILDVEEARFHDSRSLPDDLESRLVSYLEARTYPATTKLISQGDPGSGLYLLVSGRASVLLQGSDGNELRLRILLEGTLFGEISLYHHEPATATVVADSECEILHLSVASFDRLCSSDPSLAADLHAFVARTLAARVSHANRTIRALRR
ncbi:SulP family inorganic anion transporter [soil metagenome]